MTLFNSYIFFVIKQSSLQMLYGIKIFLIQYLSKEGEFENNEK